MKVVHLNTHSYGGAAEVARRLQLAGIAEGMESVFVTRFGACSDGIPTHHTFEDATLRYALRKPADDYTPSVALQKYLAIYHELIAA
jgi:hypothetical protein